MYRGASSLAGSWLSRNSPKSWPNVGFGMSRRPRWSGSVKIDQGATAERRDTAGAARCRYFSGAPLSSRPLASQCPGLRERRGCFAARGASFSSLRAAPFLNLSDTPSGYKGSAPLWGPAAAGRRLRCVSPLVPERRDTAGPERCRCGFFLRKPI